MLEPDLATLVNEPFCPGNKGTAYVEAKGGTPDYQFFWNHAPSVNQQRAENLSYGTYTLRIVDANGCETSMNFNVRERVPRIYLPNAFSPNGDGVNDEFKAMSDCELKFSMQIFNAWGSIVFSTTDMARCWDGTVEGQAAPIGKYSCIVFYSSTVNGLSFEETQRGTLRLLR